LKALNTYSKVYILLIAVFVGVYGCGKPDYNIDSQNTRIENYLNSFDGDYDYNLGAYKYTFYTRNSDKILQTGDSLYIYYVGYNFSSSNLNNIFTTNIQSEAESAGMDWTYMDKTRYGSRLGSGDLVRGLELGLPGSREGDSLYIFMASDLGYIDEAVGIIDPGTPLAFKIVIDEIVKN